jgi:hypothetical protein
MAELFILVPCRATNTQHLRDGFIRLLMHRMKEQSLTEEKEREILGAIQEFKSNFVNMKVKKDTEFVFTKTKEGGLKMVYEVNLDDRIAGIYSNFLTYFLCRERI